MTRAEERLAVLLRDAVPEPMHDVTYESVAGRARQRQRRTRRSWAAAVALLLAGSASLVEHAAVGQPAPNPGSTPTPAATAPAVPTSLRFQGVSIAVPPGWRVGVPRACGYRDDRTVTADPHPQAGSMVHGCFGGGGGPSSPLSLSVTELFGWNYSLGSVGAISSWHGQPARISTTSANGGHEAVLALPWLNAAVTATAPTAEAALALLDNVTVAPEQRMTIPAAADAVEVQVFSPKPPPATTAYVTQPVQVATLLDDLSGGLPVDPSKACSNGPGSDDVAVLTVRTGQTFRTFEVTFGACGQVTDGSGHAVTVDSALRDDVYLLLPKTSPPPPVEPASCSRFWATAATTPGDNTPGEPTEAAALAKYLSAKPAGYATDLSSWLEVASGVFVAGHTELDVVRVPAPRSGYLVGSGSNC